MLVAAERVVALGAVRSASGKLPKFRGLLVVVEDDLLVEVAELGRSAGRPRAPSRGRATSASTSSCVL